MIFLTMFDPTTKQITQPSTDSGLGAVTDSVGLMGEIVRQSERLIIFQGGIAISDYPFRLEQ